MLETSDKGISSIAVFETMNKLTPKNAVMCVDVGNNAYSFGRYFEPENQDFLMSGYLGSIGFALPAAIGAWAAVGNKRPRNRSCWAMVEFANILQKLQPS